MYVYIRSMSESQSDLYRRISDKADEIDRHIIRLVLYPHAQEVNHWKQEIYGFLNTMKKLRNTKKLPNAKFILKCLQISNDMTDALMYQVTRIEKELTPIDVSEDQVVEAIEGYQKWLAHELSTRGVIIPDDAYRVLSQVTGCD